MSRKFIGSLAVICLALTGLAIAPVSATSAAPVLVKDMNTKPESSSPEGYVEHEGILYFSAYNAQKGQELTSYNTSTGATRVFDLNLEGSSYPKALTVDHDAEVLYFFTRIRAQLTLNKLVIATGVISQIHDSNCNLFIWENTFEGIMKVWNGDLYFYTCPDENERYRYQLWKYEAGYSPAPLSFPGFTGDPSYYSNEFVMAEFNNRLYFVTYGNEETGVVASTNGTTAQYEPHFVGYRNITSMIAYDGYLMFGGAPYGMMDDLYKYDLNEVTYVDEYNDGCCTFDAEEMTIANGKLYFSAYQSRGPKALFEVNSSGEMRVVERAELDSGLYPRDIQILDGDLYFRGFDVATDENGFYVYNGTVVAKLTSFPTGNAPPAVSTVVSGGKMYFTGTSADDESEVWVFDGQNTPSKLADFNTSNQSVWVDTTVVFKGNLYWLTYGYYEMTSTLWMLSDQNVPTLVPGVTQARFSGLTALSSGLYFWYGTGDGPTELWVYTGTGSAHPVTDAIQSSDDWIDPVVEIDGKIIGVVDDGLFAINSDSSVTFETTEFGEIDSTVVFNSHLYFVAWKYGGTAFGTELYRWDGSGDAELVADIHVGENSSNISNLIVFNSKLYLLAEDGTDNSNPSMSGYDARFLYSVSTSGTLTKVSDVSCSWDCETLAEIHTMAVVGSSLFGAAYSEFGNRKLMKLNNVTGNFAPVKRNGEEIVGVSSFAKVNTFTTIASYVEGTGCVVHKLNENATLVDQFPISDDYCFDSYNWYPFADVNGNLYFRYNDGVHGEELFMFPSAGTAVKPGKIANLAVAKNGATKSSLKMTWKAPALNGGKPVINYKVEYSLNGKKWSEFKHKVSKVASITITKLKKKTKYYVRVSAITSKGTGASTMVRVSTK